MVHPFPKLPNPAVLPAALSRGPFAAGHEYLCPGVGLGEFEWSRGDSPCQPKRLYFLLMLKSVGGMTVSKKQWKQFKVVFSKRD